MLVEFKCPHCKAALKAGTDLAGTKGTCPNCKKEITVPALGPKDQNKEKKAAEGK